MEIYHRPLPETDLPYQGISAEPHSYAFAIMSSQQKILLHDNAILGCRLDDTPVCSHYILRLSKSSYTFAIFYLSRETSRLSGITMAGHRWNDKSASSRCIWSSEKKQTCLHSGVFIHEKGLYQGTHPTSTSRKLVKALSLFHGCLQP